jgi:signal transduction histidine kinase
MSEWWARLTSEVFSPHGCCYLWEPWLVWLHVTSDFLIGAAYVAITVTLVYLVRRIKGIPFQSMYMYFALFIVACGATHLMEVWNVWHGDYWTAGAVKAVTAIASVGTAIILPPLVPKGAALAEAAQIVHDRGVQLEAANEELRGLYQKTRELEQIKTQFFANVSHELRTPLTLIIGPVEKWLGSATIQTELRGDLELVGRNARTLLKHVNDLLDVSKLEAGKMSADYAETDLARLVRVVAGNFEGLAKEHKIAYAVEAPEHLAAETDPDKLERVLLNLLSNAFKFTPDGGAIRVGLGAAGDQAEIVVADSGPGVPENLREAVFERFHRGDGGSTRRFGGTGLGLAIAKDFVTLHGGTIRIGTAPEGGALLTVMLPLKAPSGARVRPARPSTASVLDQMARQALEELSTRVQSVASAGEGKGRGRVLVVEDNREMSKFLVEALSRDYDCERALDGEDGLKKARETRPDLVLSDVMMPRMSGDEMVREIRKTPELDAVPVVLLTAKADEELRVRMLREGAQDYLVKPFSIEELRARVGNLVTMKRARELLQRELETQLRDLEKLAAEITGRKRELQTALDTVRVAKEHAERASKFKSDFLNMVSHELRTPLSTLVFQLDVMEKNEKDPLTQHQRTALRRMTTAVGRLSQMVTSLLDYARLEAGKLEIERSRVNVRELAGEVVEELRPQATQKGLGLRLVSATGDPIVETDARLLRVAITNLVGNAVKFTDKGEVVVTVEPSEAGARVAVRDTGHGIPKEKQAVIFEPFEQLEPIYSKSEPGVGLGLSIVRAVVHALGGHAEVASTLGEGSTFTLTVPPSAGVPGHGKMPG